MKKLVTLATVLWAGAAHAHHEMTPLREAMIDGHRHDVGGATMWLALAVVAMVAALWAVHWSIFRRK